MIVILCRALHRALMRYICSGMLPWCRSISLVDNPQGDVVILGLQAAFAVLNANGDVYTCVTAFRSVCAYSIFTECLFFS